MVRTAGLRLAAGVIGVGAGGVTFVFGVLMLLFGGVLAAVSSTSGSLAGSGVLLIGFSLLAILISAGFFFMPLRASHRSGSNRRTERHAGSNLHVIH